MALTDDQKVLTLRITGNPDGGGTREGVFKARVGEGDNGLSVSHEMRTGYLAQGGQTINSIISALTDSGESQNKQFVIDGGQSQFALEARFIGFGGSGYRWGDSGNGGTGTDATGDSAIAQAQVLMNWIRKTNVDSLPESLAGEATNSYGPATLEYGLHHPNGPLDPLEVAIENPQLTPQAGDRVDGVLTFVEIASLNNPLDSTGNSKRGSSST